MRYVCSLPNCDIATTKAYCHEHRADDDQRVTCLVCRGKFDSMPFYGCCSGCYSVSATVRALVDEAHPQTMPVVVQL